MTRGRFTTTLVLALAMLTGSFALVLPRAAAQGTAETCSASEAFTDVPAGAYFTEAVAWAACNGITTGTSSTTFSPHAQVNRAQFATFLWRYAGEPNTHSRHFTDVPAGSYFDEPAAWIAGEGIAAGTSDTSFSPLAPVNRAAAATFLWRFANKPEASNTTPFSDVPAGRYYTEPVAWLYANGFTTGTSPTTFRPTDNLTRAQLVTFLYRFRDDAAKKGAVGKILDAFDSHKRATGSYGFDGPGGNGDGQGWFEQAGSTVSIAQKLVDDGHLTADYLTELASDNFIVLMCNPAGEGVDGVQHVAVFAKVDSIAPTAEGQTWWAKHNCPTPAAVGYGYFAATASSGTLETVCWTENTGTAVQAGCSGPVGFSRRI